MWATVAVVMFALGGCGRVGFDPVAFDADGDSGDGVDGLRDSSGDGPPATSCAGLAFTCGPMGTASCCESPAVSGGTYSRSYDVSGDGMYPGGTFVATVSDFRLDKYEVTVGRFRQFVMGGQGTQAAPPLSGAGAHPNITNSGWDTSWNGSLAADPTALGTAMKCDATYQTWTDTPGGNESRPMVCITWYEAMAFCAWDGGFLPSEAEWNYAASGGSEQRAYPWSIPPGLLGIDGTHASWSCMGDGVPGCSRTDLLVVGTKPAGDGRWGQSDLGGNVYEWILDWYATPYPQIPCTDCANLTPATDRVDRGGCFPDGLTRLRAGARSSDPPTRRNFVVGVRCARAP